MGNKSISQKTRLAAVFASFAVLSIGTISLMETMSIDYYTVLSTLQKILPASVILGGLGWVMGTILEKPRRRSSAGGYNNLFLNNAMRHDIAAAEGSEGLNDITPDL